MNPINATGQRMTNYRWVICAMLFFALVINYLDRQVLSLTWKNFIAPEFHWTDADYGMLTGVFSIVYAVAMLLAGRLVDRMGTKKGYLIAIFVWSTGACIHTVCGILTNGFVTGDWIWSFAGAREHLESSMAAVPAIALTVTSTSVWLFMIARVVLSLGEAGNFPCSIKAVAEYFPKKDRGFATGVFNSGSQIGALLAPFTIPVIAACYGWEMSFFIIGILGYLWMGVWIFVYRRPRENRRVNAAELAYIEQDNACDAVAEKTDFTAEQEPQDARVGLFKAFSFRQTWAVIF